MWQTDFGLALLLRTCFASLLVLFFTLELSGPWETASFTAGAAPSSASSFCLVFVRFVLVFFVLVCARGVDRPRVGTEARLFAKPPRTLGLLQCSCGRCLCLGGTKGVSGAVCAGDAGREYVRVLMQCNTER